MACPAELEAASEAPVHYGDSESLKSVHDCWAKRLWAESWPILKVQFFVFDVTGSIASVHFLGLRSCFVLKRMNGNLTRSIQPRCQKTQNRTGICLLACCYC